MKMTLDDTNTVITYHLEPFEDNQPRGADLYDRFGHGYLIGEGLLQKKIL